MGGSVDMVIQRFVDFMFALPGLLIAIVIVGVAGGGYWMAVLVLSLLNFAGSVRIIRGASLEQRALPYVEAARTLGVPRHRIMYFHIWRNISPIVFASAALDFALALVALSSLSYLGLGTSPGVPEWGRMLAENQAAPVHEPGRRPGPRSRDRAVRHGGDGDRRLDLRQILVQRQNGPLTWPRRTSSWPSAACGSPTSGERSHERWSTGSDSMSTAGRRSRSSGSPAVARR